MSGAESAQLASIAAVLLAGILAWSAAAKWNDRHLTVLRFARLGVPAPATVVPAVVAAEAVSAIALVTAPRVGGVLAGALLIAFTVFLVGAIRRGVTVGCGCFGGTADRPVGAHDLVRNAGLIGLAATAMTTTSLVRPSLAALVLASVIALAAVVVASLADLRHQTGGRLWVLPEPGELAGGRR